MMIVKKADFVKAMYQTLGTCIYICRSLPEMLFRFMKSGVRPWRFCISEKFLGGIDCTTISERAKDLVHSAESLK